MVWTWSHTQEAYWNVRVNISYIPRVELEVMWAEWKAYQWEKENEGECAFTEGIYDTQLKIAKTLIVEGLVSDIQDKVSKLGECEEGGFQAYGCPYYCYTHRVSFEEIEGRCYEW